MKHCLGIHLLSREEILAAVIKGLRLLPDYLQDKPMEILGLPLSGGLTPLVSFVFEELSSRTLNSQIEAALRCGFRTGQPITPQNSSIGKGEPPTRTLITLLQQQTRMICSRTTTEGWGLQAANYLERESDRFPEWFRQTPIINCGDGRQDHPTQLLLDVVAYIAYKLGAIENGCLNMDALINNLAISNEALADFITKQLNNLTIALVGDLKHSRVTSSWIDLGHKFDIKFILVAPPAFEVEPWRLKNVRCSITEKLHDALEADICYTIRMQMERLGEVMSLPEAERVVQDLQVDSSFLQALNGVLFDAQPLDGRRPMIHPSCWNHPKNLMDFEALCGPPTRAGVYQICWANRFDHHALSVIQETVPDVLKESDIPSHLASKAPDWNMEQRAINPLTNGMVLDRLPAGLSLLIDKLLSRGNLYGNGGSDAIIAQRRRSAVMPGGKKDIIFLENRFVPYSTLAAIQVFCQQMRVVELQNGQYRKMSFSLPQAIADLLVCPNAACVTRVDPEAKSLFEVESVQDDSVFFHCAFCRHRFTVGQMKAALA